jgi:hypothetical protein
VDELPIVPHGGKCSGCLIVIDLENGNANLVCNECEMLIRTAPIDDVPNILARFWEWSTGMCSAVSRHCQASNTFLGTR